MGNVCSGNQAGMVSNQAKGSPQAPNKLMTRMKTVDADSAKNKANTDQPWRALLLDKEVLVKSVHPHVLIRFKTGEEETPRPKSEDNSCVKSIEEKPAQAADDDDDEYYEEDDGRWLCNGTQLFRDGCKSG